ncbi:MAG TPA: helix-turn-helix domain-containing protein [Acidimicrobiales bacterium]|jgi:AcrR family transcriptional regulator
METSVADDVTTETRILDAAEACLSRLGLRRVSMTDVAVQAGVSRGSVYFHFGDRATLVDAVLTRVATRFVESSMSAVRSRRTLAGQVGEAAVFIRQHLGDELLTLRLPAEGDSLLATLLSVQIERLLSEWIEFWLPFLADAEKRGEIRTGLDHRRASEWIVRTMLSFAVMPSVTFDMDDPDAVRSFVHDHLIAGLAA